MKSPYRHTHALVLTLLMCAFSSCYKEIDLDEYRNAAGRDLLTLNALLTPDSVIMVSAKETYFYSDIHNAPVYVKDLDIRLSINDEDKGRLTYDNKKNIYLSNVKPNPGDKVEVSTVYKGKTVYARDIVPSQIEMESLDVRVGAPHRSSSGLEVCTITYRIKFKDKKDCNNFYFLRCDAPQFTGDGKPNTGFGQFNFSHDIVFQKLERYLGDMPSDWLTGNFPWGLPFSDDGIDGNAHTLVLEENVPYPFYNKDIVRDIRLYEISRPYFDFLASCLKYNSVDEDSTAGMIDLGLADPMRTYTNVENGVGILGCYTLSHRIINAGSFSAYATTPR